VHVFSSYTNDPKRPGQPADTTLEDYIAFRDRARSVRDLIASSDFRPSLEDDPSEVGLPCQVDHVTKVHFLKFDLVKPIFHFRTSRRPKAL
jgi:hypothetical protein